MQNQTPESDQAIEASRVEKVGETRVKNVEKKGGIELASGFGGD